MHAKKRTKTDSEGAFVTRLVEKMELTLFEKLISPRFKNASRVQYVGHDRCDASFLLKVFPKTLKFIHTVSPDRVRYNAWDVNETPVEKGVRSVLSKNLVGHDAQVGFRFQVKI